MSFLSISEIMSCLEFFCDASASSCIFARHVNLFFRCAINYKYFYPSKSLLQMGLLAVTDKAAMAEDIPATVKQVMVQEGEGMDQVKVLP